MPVLLSARRLIGSGEIVRNPSLKSDRDRRRRLTALQGEVAVADQTADLVVADPNRQAPQPHAGPRATRLACFSWPSINLVGIVSATAPALDGEPSERDQQMNAPAALKALFFARSCVRRRERP